MMSAKPCRRRLLVTLAVAAAAMLSGRGGAAELATKLQIVTNVAYQDADQSTFSPDGRYILIGNSRATVRLWEAATGRLVRSYVAKSSDDRQYVYGIGFSPSLDVVVSNDRYGNVSIWKASTGQLLRSISAGDLNPQRPFVFTPDGKRMLSANTAGKEIRFWDTATWKVVRIVKVPSGFTEFSRDCRYAVVRGDDSVALIDLASGHQLWSAKSSATSAAAFSADGSRVAVGAGDPDHGKDKIGATNGMIRVFDTKSGSELRTFTYDVLRPDVWSLAFSPDGTRLFAESVDGAVRSFDIQAGRLVDTVRIAVDDDVQDVLFSPGGDRLWSIDASGDGKIWNRQTGELISKFGRPIGGVARLAFLGAPAGSSSGAGNTASILAGNIDFDDDSAAIHRWAMSNGHLVGSTALGGIAWNGYQPELVFSSDGSFAVSGTAERPVPDGDKPKKPGQPSINVWNLTTGKSMQTLHGRPDAATVAVSADGKLIFSTDQRARSDDDPANSKLSVTLWNCADARTLWTTTIDGEASCAAFSPNGSRIAVCGSDGVRILDAANGKLLHFLDENSKYGISSVAFAPNSRTLIEGNGDWEDNASIWDVESGKRLHTLHGHAKVVLAVAYSPDGKHVITGGQDGTARIWNMATGAQERVLRLDSASPFESVTYSADGAQIITGHMDGSVAIWNNATGALVVTLVASPDGEWVAITPEGFFDASPKGSALLHVVNGLDVVSIDQVFQNLFRPDLVREKLAGDPQGKVRAAAAKLDLAKIFWQAARRRPFASSSHPTVVPRRKIMRRSRSN